MDEMITFEKDFQDRLEEYLVLFEGDKILTAPEIKKQWSIYMEFILDTSGWQALWKIPRVMCEKLEIPFPSVVIVHIESVNLTELNAAVKVVAVQGNLVLPLSHTASLTKLWPTKQQNTTIDAISIANALDMYRFFYYYLWMPWDLRDYNNTDWSKNNLVDRLRLHYNIKNGLLPNYKIRKFRALLTEVRTLLEAVGDDGTSRININISDNTPPDRMQKLIDLNFKMCELKTEIEILRTFHYENKHENLVSDYWLCFNSGNTLDRHTNFLQAVKSLNMNSNKFKSAISLQDAIDSANVGDTILVGDGTHDICFPGVLDEGVIVKNPLLDRTKVIIESCNENSFVDFTGKQLIIENVSIYTPNAQCGIIAQTGMIYIKNCIITGQNSSSSQHGIVALPGSDIHLENCYISGFNTGLNVSSFSSMSLHNCTLSNMDNPIKIYTNGNIEVINCKFTNYKQHVIHFETDSEETKVGDISLLKSAVSAKFVDCSFGSDGKDSTPVAIINKRLL